MPDHASESTASEVDSGPSLLGSFAYYDRASRRLKTYQGSLFEDWTESSLTLPRSGSMRSGRLYAHPTWEPPTSESACSSWPTPNTKDRDSAARHTTETGVMHPGTTLTDAVRADWSTPTCRDQESLAKVTRGANAVPGGTPLLVQVASGTWPTPKGSDSNGLREPDGKRGMGLNDVACHEMYPTPTSRDYRFPNATTYEDRGGGTKGEQLNNFVAQLDGPRDPASPKKGGNLRASSVVLEPAFVESWMGFPLGWTDLLE
jgi:hypothetical protein